jgi:hypothetical protein
MRGQLGADFRHDIDSWKASKDSKYRSTVFDGTMDDDALWVIEAPATLTDPNRVGRIQTS